jgi:hypothetical protein
MKSGVTEMIAPTISCGTASCPVAPEGVSAQEVDNCETLDQQTPLACNAFALTPEQRQRHFEQLVPFVLSRKRRVRELDDGYEFQFFAAVSWLNRQTQPFARFVHSADTYT